MTINELSDKKLKLERKYYESLHNLCDSYAMEHNPYKIGDIIEDYDHRIKIQSIHGTGKGYLLFIGLELKKNNRPKRKQICPVIYSCQVKRKIEVQG